MNGQDFSGKVYNTLRTASADRAEEWGEGTEGFSPSYFAVEMGGEVGEALNVVKKLERERIGAPGSRDTVEHLAEELADVIITAVNLANAYGIDLNSAVVNKFNATSEKVGLPHMLAGRIRL